MTRFLVDSNVLLDLITRETDWYAWSASTISRCRNQGMLAVNPLIYSEVSVDFHGIEEVDAAFPEIHFLRLPLPWEAAFLAGQCFRMYRRRGGKRTSPLPDFYIGAHAAVSGMVLVTRDARRYRTYFPKLQLIAP